MQPSCQQPIGSALDSAARERWMQGLRPKRKACAAAAYLAPRPRIRPSHTV